MKITEILTEQEMNQLTNMNEYAVPVWAINNMLRMHWKDLTIDQWIELQKLYEISGIESTIAEQTEIIIKSTKKIRNAIELTEER